MQHLPQPFDLIQAAVRAKQQRRMALNSHFSALVGIPGAAKAWYSRKKAARVGKTGFHRHALGAVDDRYFMSLLLPDTTRKIRQQHQHLKQALSFSPPLTFSKQT